MTALKRPNSLSRYLGIMRINSGQDRSKVQSDQTRLWSLVEFLNWHLPVMRTALSLQSLM